MNTPEQIAERCIEDIIRRCGGLDEWPASTKQIVLSPVKAAIAEATQPLHQRLIDTEKAAGFCDKHKPNGGSRNCLVCGCEELSHCLSQISYACGQPNEIGVSDYDTHYDPAEVVKQVKQRLIAAEVQVGKMREALRPFAEMDPYLSSSHVAVAEEAYKSTPSPRTHEAFTAMMKALEGLFPLVHVESKEGLALASALKQAKEVGAV